MYLYIQVIGRVITIWEEVLFKLGVSFDRLVTRKGVFSKYIHRNETNLDVVIEFLEI